MFKKLLVASAVLAASSVAFAGPSYKGDYKGEMPTPTCPTYSYVTGPYVGVSVGARTNYSGTPAVFSGLDGTLSAGYGALWNQAFYLAGEIFVLGTANLKDMPNQLGVSAKSNWSWGLSVLPGYMLTDHVLGYLRLGGARTSFNGEGVNTNKTGWQVGLGGQTQLMANWDLRAEYVYSYYSSVSGIGNTSANQANVGLVYKFV